MLLRDDVPVWMRSIVPSIPEIVEKTALLRFKEVCGLHLGFEGRFVRLMRLEALQLAMNGPGGCIDFREVP
ncbi:hypothetical protein RRU01S_13_00120 [Agrobacterium rubi TR3 = NBRC 13261]|uniref:Uncharacterized protein n=1 Tax=Agrobacterium rubi TR3 = NBRC 13261 TaxID=1368415 RepID=A0A081CVH8_9HYPH|nr:hypothetical protein RRU01S_13_00120 [Agrobacterium rubi TR3 = NBRC 13261]